MDRDSSTPPLTEHDNPFAYRSRLDRVMAHLYAEGHLGARPSGPAVIFQHPSAPVSLTEEQQAIAARVRAKHAKPIPPVEEDRPSMLAAVNEATERQNAIFFLDQLADRYTVQPLQHTLALVKHFGVEAVQRWLTNIATVRGER